MVVGGSGRVGTGTLGVHIYRWGPSWIGTSTEKKSIRVIFTKFDMSCYISPVKRCVSLRKRKDLSKTLPVKKRYTQEVYTIISFTCFKVNLVLAFEVDST